MQILISHLDSLWKLKFCSDRNDHTEFPFPLTVSNLHVVMLWHLYVWGRIFMHQGLIPEILSQGGSSLQLYKSVHSQASIWDLLFLSRGKEIDGIMFFILWPDFYIAQGHIDLSSSWLQRVFGNDTFNTWSSTRKTNI